MLYSSSTIEFCVTFIYEILISCDWTVTVVLTYCRKTSKQEDILAQDADYGQ